MEKQTPTLLVFTLGPARERRRRRLLPDRLGQLEDGLHQRCLDGAFEAGREAGCRIAVSAPRDLALPSDVGRLTQTGEGFEDRLANAVEEAQGDGTLVVIGTDTPGLTSSHIATARQQVEERPDHVVLGPATDGGIYLLASARPLADLLRGIRWRRGDCLEQLVRALEARGLSVSLLEPQGDLDRRQDLERWLAGRAGAVPRWSLVARLRRVLAALGRRIAPPTLGRPRLAPIPVRAGRAPPRRPSL